MTTYFERKTPVYYSPGKAVAPSAIGDAFALPVGAEEPKPKRPLSAYNFFFKRERQDILRNTPVRPQGKPRRSHGKIGFADLARTIAARWKGADHAVKDHFENMAKMDKDRYARELEDWKINQDNQKLVGEKSIPHSCSPFSPYWEETQGDDFEPIEFQKSTKTPAKSRPISQVVTPTFTTKQPLGLSYASDLARSDLGFGDYNGTEQWAYSDRVSTVRPEKLRNIEIDEVDFVNSCSLPRMGYKNPRETMLRYTNFYDRRRPRFSAVFQEEGDRWEDERARYLSFHH
ncbi:predicted protein [Phaeodactylum tricornutum CCAP 1055/1]|jgi:hypothetical protein|uniref:HMG box domain-containing protein n=1 Tax=Phaeodactylum tricornutum (strain CCAP 1055/1) TaxID=556484 RepID=B7FVD1_PHATC|nr:predicted protein [Phaeodactylum tricornutum CCAP 1055/1]EEC49814.1 predicted protein [Phaeodactylum tricornutum CCAP 1055/1]|eukprot:XP_002179116.1 predicted protein [Phaeodactylum tricornutum CCAP 1055/1]